MYGKIKKWYKQGLWTEKMVKDAGEKGVLTKLQVETILSI